MAQKGVAESKQQGQRQRRRESIRISEILLLCEIASVSRNHDEACLNGCLIDPINKLTNMTFLGYFYSRLSSILFPPC